MPRVNLGSDRLTLQQHQIALLERDSRRLRLALRGVLPHLTLEQRVFPEQVLDETRL